MTFQKPDHVVPHRPPFLFIDEVVACSETTVHAVRTFRAEEDFFRGHFPGRPIVPGVILIEAMAQTLAYLALTRLPNVRNVYLTGIEKARFRKPVLPGEKVDFFLTYEGTRMGLSTARCEARVGDVKVADARLSGLFES